MSILGYSTSYFLPEYWGSTPLYGEKIIPLLDYILSTEYVEADKLANAFYLIENKYKNTANLPIEAIEEIIKESGYEYVRALFGNDEETTRLLVYLLVLIHQLKGTKLGIEVVLNLLKKSNNNMLLGQVGNPTLNPDTKEVSNITTSDYILYNGFTVDQEPFDFYLQIRTPSSFNAEQCLASSSNYGFSINLTSDGTLSLSLGSNRSSWDIAEGETSKLFLSPSTTYNIKLSFDGYSYVLKVGEEGGNYSDFITVDSTVPLNIHQGVVYIGVDGSTGTICNPFKGFINLSPFAIDVRNATITQWFEQFPVGSENTFIIKADLDITTISTDFFDNFATFVKKYVYPTLEGFEAKLSLKNNLTFIPYVRQRIKYVASYELGKGLRWTSAVQDVNLGSRIWSAITYDGTKFVALSVTGYISTSTNGTTWTSATQISNLARQGGWAAIAYNGAKFVALGHNGYVSTSTNGTTWTLATHNTNLGSRDWAAITYDGTKFVALSANGYLSTSTNGTTWTNAEYKDNLGSHYWASLIYDGTAFVALGRTGYISNSRDGITWVRAARSTNLGSRNWVALAYDGTEFVALDGNGYTSTLQTPAVQDVNLGSHNWEALACDGTEFVALGSTGYLSIGKWILVNAEN